jgi:ATP-dependent exoDNAse (exonuclease V) beta subunit
MSDLRRDDQLAREAALDVTRSFIVQAPAGSGKTELLTRRFLALLATVQSPESVLAITFTRKAAAEMRNRILGALRAADGDVAASGQLHGRTLELARAALAVDRRLGWDLLGNPARLRIQTIDSLNLGLARRLPVLSGLGAGLGVEEDGRELYRAAAERLLEHLPAGDSRHSAAVATLLGHVDNRVQRFVGLVIEMLARRESWGAELPRAGADEASSAELREQLEATRAGLVTSHLAALARQFPRELLAEAWVAGKEAAATLIGNDQESPVTGLEHCDTLPGETAEDAPAWLALATLLLTESGGTPRKVFDYKIGFPAGQESKERKARARELTLALEALPDLVQQLHAVRQLPEPHYTDDEWRVLEAQLIVLRLAAAELEVVFAERRAADYPRFAAAALESLGDEDMPTDTALALDATLSHVLVDEFQDTSETQVRLLRGLTAGWQRGDGRTLFLVGDPMQSIYRFRNAEVALFLDVRKNGIGDLQLQPLTLAVNFRSTEPVIDWVNQCFARILPPHDDVVRGAVSYSPSTTAEGAGADGGVVVHPLFRRSRLFEAAEVADVVERRLAEDPDANVAILVQGRSHLVNIVAELARRGVPFQATDIDPLGERPVVLDLLALTRAIAHPADRPAWLATLRAPWCGLTLAELYAICGDSRDSTLPELLRDTQRHARIDAPSRARLNRAWRVLAEAPLELRRFGLRDAVERAWLALGGPATASTARELDEAQAYLDELAEVERRAGGPIDLAMLAEALEKLYAPSRPDKSVRVELMTVHKAKGLQFDTVIVPGLERRPRADDKRLLQWARLPGNAAREIVVAPIAGTGADPNRLYRWLEGIEADKLREEKRRLLYVAATRAKRWLHLFGTCQLKAQPDGGATIVRPTSSVALGMLWPVVEHEFQARLGEAGAVEGEAAPEIARDPLLRRLPLEWHVPKVVAPRIQSERARRAAATSAVEFDWATETARHVGTVVHRELQRIAREGKFAAIPDPATRRRFDDELAELGVPADRRVAAVDRVVTAVQRTIDDERGHWLLDPRHASAANELALTGRVDGEIVSVIIDRTFVDESGTRWIVDYKTSSHEGAGLDEFLASEEERYRPQLERYAALMRRLGNEPVKLGLYFPLLSAWRTWS